MSRYRKVIDLCASMPRPLLRKLGFGILAAILFLLANSRHYGIALSSQPCVFTQWPAAARLTFRRPKANVAGSAGIVDDSSGNFYIASPYKNRVFKVNHIGNIFVSAGNGSSSYRDDGGPAASSPGRPLGGNVVGAELQPSSTAPI
jgi:hypothetical protein